MRWLDRRGYPQRIVSLLRRRVKVKGLVPYSSSQHEGVHAVGLSVSNPMLSHQALLTDFVPKSFGSWRDYVVVNRLVADSQVIAILRDQAAGIELSLVMPRHSGFPVWRFRRTKRVRLTREGIRSGLVTVRDPDGLLLAAGALELRERASFSYRWGTSS